MRSQTKQPSIISLLQPPPETDRADRPRPSRPKLAELMRSKRRTPGPEQRPLRGVSGNKWDQRAPRERGPVRATEQRRRDD